LRFIVPGVQRLGGVEDGSFPTGLRKFRVVNALPIASIKAAAIKMFLFFIKCI
jgi:hypothetical protein